MANGSFKVKNSANLDPQTGSVVTTKGDLAYNASTDKLEVYNGAADPIVSETKAATLANKTLNSPTLVTPALGTPASGVMTNVTGTAAGLTAGTVTTNANLTGPITSSGNTTSVAAQTGTGSTFVMQTSPTLTTPNIGTPSAGVLTNATGLPLTSGVTGTLGATNGGTAQSTYTTGDILYASATNTLSKLPIGSANQVVKVVNGLPAYAAAPSGGVNYVSANPDAETDTAGWATYADAAANIPVDGTGGTATNLTFSRSTSSPLRGVASFSMVQANSTSLQGKGVSYDFTIDSADQAKPLSITFDYNASSTFIASNGTTAPLNDGTTSTNAGNSDIEIFIYDKTNAVLIPVSPQVITANGSNNFSYKGTFQTASNSTSYRLIYHVASTSANATGWTFKFDNVSVGPQVILQGPPVTDWTDYTASITVASGGLTNNTNTSRWRRVGDTLECEGNITFSGAPSSFSQIRVAAPTGLTFDTTKFGTTTTDLLIGTVTFLDAGVAVYRGHANIFSTTQVNLSIDNTAGTYGVGSNPSETVPYTIGNGDIIQWEFSMPISGWSSTTTMSNDADTRVVAAKYTFSTSKSPTSNNPLDFDTVSYDTHSAVTTGSSWKFTCPVSGKYVVKTSFQTSSGVGANFKLYKNGSADTSIASMATTNTVSGTTDVSLIAGDTVYCGPESTTTFGNGSISISRISGPSTIAASETVAFSYSNTAGTSITNGSFQALTFPTKDFDTHNAVSSGVFTAPIAGKYRFSAQVAWSSGSNQTTTAIALYKNGALVNYLSQVPGSSTIVVMHGGTKTIQMLAGDTASIQVFQNATGAQGINNTAGSVYFEGNRVGN